jgi:hypothetical protein
MGAIKNDFWQALRGFETEILPDEFADIGHDDLWLTAAKKARIPTTTRTGGCAPTAQPRR